jgi:hypothetical protein
LYCTSPALDQIHRPDCFENGSRLLTIAAVPSLIEYEQLVSRMSALGMRSLYYNSGAFGPVDSAAMKFVGWIGPDDPSIRPEALAAARRVPPPYEPALAKLAARAWCELFPGPAWIMPKSHWAYELDFGSKQWMPAALARLGIDSENLAPRTTAPAIQFKPSESDLLQQFVQTLLENLRGSDFALAFPNHPTLCTIHHHKQLWWVTTDAAILDQLSALFGKPAA